MDIIDKHLATAALDDRYCPPIQAALAVGKNLLNKYYNMTDHSELFRIAMGTWLHTLLLFKIFLKYAFQFSTQVTSSAISELHHGMTNG
jgi:hypothetical protein